tara:strand:+ start:75 stop:1118 length:1044 start_codon:yes stop_codon:yes gene_type:complete
MAISDTFDPSVGTPTSSQGPSVSNREDLTDVLTILAPEETPALSSANKQRATSTFVEWTVDSLSSPSTTGISEGADITSFTDQFANRARLGNYVQKFRRDYMVSDLQEAVDSVGPAKVAQAEAKAIRELKRDIEATILSDNEQQAETGAQPYKLRGIGQWVESAANTGSAGVPSNVATDYLPPAASISTAGASITEAQFNTIVRSIYRVNGEANNLVLIADTSLRKQIADFARFGVDGTAGNSDKMGVRSVNYDGMNSTIKLSVEVYQSDFGIVSIVNMNPETSPDTLAGGADHDRGYMINPEYYGIHELIPMGSTRLPNMGGGERGFVDCALTLGVYAPAAHGKIV